MMGGLFSNSKPPNTASPTPCPALCAGGALGERQGFHAADPPPLRSRLTRRKAAEARWAGQAAQLRQLSISFDGWRSGRRLAGRRHFVADTA
jgi:hypothetical protein